MITLTGGLILFIGAHSLSMVAPEWRARQVSSLGPLAWRALFSAVSLIGLILIVKGYESARLAPRFAYLAPYWTRNVATVLMLPVFPLLLATYFPGRIKSATGHPMLIATVIWAGAHLIVNGTVPDLFLFGSLLLWALALIATADSRPARKLPGAPPSARNDAIALGGGFAIYALIVLWGHRALIGLPVLV